MDITGDREREETAAEEQRPPMFEDLLNEGQKVFQAESVARVDAAIAKLEALSKPGQQYGVPPDAERNALINAIAMLIVERGICSHPELVLRKNRALAELIEECAASAEEHAATHTDIILPNGGAPPPMPNREQRRRR